MEQTQHSTDQARQRGKSLAWRIQSYADLSAMSADELADLLAEYEAEVVRLRGALSASDPAAEWVDPGRRALDRLNLICRWIERAIGERKDKEKQARHKAMLDLAAKSAQAKAERTKISAESRDSDMSAFVRAARLVLPIDTYLRIWDVANGKQQPN